MDLFDKCRDFTLADEVKAMGLYPFFHPITGNEGPIVYMNNRKTVMAGSNNYLGLTTDPRVKEATIAATRKYGSGCSGSRFLNGSLDIHFELEEKLAEFTGKEAALLYSTGFQTNQGAIVGIIKKGDYIISDKENHASIIQGCLIAKATCGPETLVTYEHNDMMDLERVISRLPLDAGKLIVVDGVFSMNGDIINLPEVVRIARKYNARIMCDDAHSLGVLGDLGRGTANHFGLTADTDIIMGTFSKSLASQGGFISSEKNVLNFIKHNSPALIYNASMPAGQVAAVLKALEIMQAEPERIRKLHSNARKIRTGLRDLGFNVKDGETPVVPILINGDDMLFTFRFWRKLLDNGVFSNPVIYPAVPVGMQLIRLSFMATHEDEHLDFVLDRFEKIGRETKILDNVA
ncbi:MAG: aminotransferase class I/II-fold pyridoxal phosphate-dependent enzyme [Spirochaetes bacterium]|nr:MAG: aminotransferase class I/II-fold pyridoxal phosphate-dependent enzyme [Spirochaetota bacterium]